MRIVPDRRARTPSAVKVATPLIDSAFNVARFKIGHTSAEIPQTMKQSATSRFNAYHVAVTLIYNTIMIGEMQAFEKRILRIL